MTDSISFIHAADLHLDSPFKGLTQLPAEIFKDVKKSTFYALDQLVQTAILKNVDFILLVGDLFDNEKQSLKAQVHLRTAFETLRDHEIDVFLSYGNHDHILGNPYRLEYPENVYTFPHEEVSHFTYRKNDNTLAQIYGFSYHHRAVQTNKIMEYVIQDEHIPFHIATLHGSINGNKAHDPYAPFSLKELQATSFDYWALGHIHEREELSKTPPIVYPGNTQGRHRNEPGAKGCYIVEMSSVETTFEFTPLQAIQFIDLHIDVSTCENISDIEHKILASLPSTNGKQLIHLTLTSTTYYLNALRNDGIVDELIEMINDAQCNQIEWQYIYKHHVDVYTEQHIPLEDNFIKEIENTIESLNTNEVLGDLFKHPVARKYITAETDKTIKKAAQEILFQELLQTKEREER